jgi:hypothetical protein
VYYVFDISRAKEVLVALLLIQKKVLLTVDDQAFQKYRPLTWFINFLPKIQIADNASDG